MTSRSKDDLDAAVDRVVAVTKIPRDILLNKPSTSSSDRFARSARKPRSRQPWHLVDERKTIRGQVTYCGTVIGSFWEIANQEQAHAASREFWEEIEQPFAIEQDLITPFCSNCIRVESVRIE